jgi:gliding motility associated protien GldN
MRNKSNFCCLIAAFALIALTQNLEAQRAVETCADRPLDAIYSTNMSERVPLAYPHLEQRDVLWEKRIWREIDVKELRNHHFASPNKYFIDILLSGLEKKKIRAFSAENENFTKEQNFDDISKMISKTDTIPVTDPVTEAITMMPVKREFNPTNVIKYRIKEIVYFDSKLGRMNTRILGIAPIVNINDSEGNLIASTVLCWFHYNDIRSLLAKEALLSDHSDTQGLSWDDVFQARFFSSYIIKESNVKDARLQDLHSGMAILHESEKIKEEIRNKELDFFSEN